MSKKKKKKKAYPYQELRQVLVGDIGQLGAVELGDDELCFIISTT